MVDIRAGGPDMETFDLIDDFSSLIWTDRYYGAGNFELEIPSTKANIKICKSLEYLKINSSDRTMVVEEEETKGGIITLKGRSLESILDRRVVEAVPPPQSQLINAVIGLVSYNLGPNAAAERRSEMNILFYEEPPENFVEPGVIGGINWGDSLYEAVLALTMSGGLGFKILHRETFPTLHFHFYKGYENVRKRIVYSDALGNLAGARRFKSKTNYKNLAVVNLPPWDDSPTVGDIQRVHRETSLPRGLNRREIWIDASDLRRDETFNAQNKPQRMRLWGQKEIVNHKPLDEIDFESSTGIYKYLEDFELGDLVWVIDDDDQEKFRHRVLEYIQAFGPESESSYPSLSYEPED